MLTAILMTTLLVGSDVAPPETGSIQGRILYPSCMGPPADLVICAENTKTAKKHCTPRIFFEAGFITYRLTLPPGQFQVFAQSEDEGHRGYFSEAVKCGLSIDCQDHTAIEVSVGLREMVTDIDVADWVLEEEAY